MHPIVIAIISIVVILGALIVIRGLRRDSRLLEMLFVDRPALTHKDFGVLYFPEAPDVAATLRAKLEGKIGKDLSRLHPDDALSIEILLGQDLDVEEFFMQVEDHYGIHFNDQELSNLSDLTLESLVPLVQRQLKQHRTA